MSAASGRGTAWSAAALLVASCLLFSLVGVLVKLLSSTYSSGELVFYRSLVGMVCMAAYARWMGIGLATPVPGLHARRCAAGVLALSAWFHSMGGLPLATAMTLNATSSLWMAAFFGAGALLGRGGVERRLVWAVLAGFVGVAAVLQPTIRQDQWLHGLLGLGSGMLAALAYVQLIALARAGEPEERAVFYFCIGGMLAGAGLTLASGGPNGHTASGLALLLLNGLLATVAQWMMTRAFSIGRPLANATLQYAGIVFSFLLGVWIFDDPVTPLAVGGMILIVAAGIVVTGLRQKRQEDTAHPGDP